MPFAGLVTGAGGPACPAAGIAEGSYVLVANWIDVNGNQVGDPNNQLLTSYPPEAQFSPVTFTGPRGTLRVTKVVSWGSKKKNTAQTFQICISGPSTVPCQTVGYNGGVVTFSDLVPGSYTVSETNPGVSWLVTIAGSPATVTATAPAAATVTNTAADPDIDIDKKGPTLVTAGSAAVYTYSVKNDGNVALTNVTVTDTKCASPVKGSGDAAPIGTLDVGETWKFSCSYTPAFTPTKTLTNKATATANYGVQLASDSDSYTLRPFTLKKVVYKLNGTTKATQPDTTTFQVRVKRNKELLPGTFPVSQAAPLKVWLGSGDFTFIEVPVTGYTPNGPVKAENDDDDAVTSGTLWNRKGSVADDDDPAPPTTSPARVSIAGASIAEGRKGQRSSMVFTVRLSRASTSAVTVR